MLTKIPENIEEKYENLDVILFCEDEIRDTYIDDGNVQNLKANSFLCMFFATVVVTSFTCVYEKYQTKGQSILNVVQLGLGAIVGNLVGGKLIRLLGYEKGYLLMAGITTLMTICALIVYFWKNREQRNGGDVCEI